METTGQLETGKQALETVGEMAGRMDGGVT